MSGTQSAPLVSSSLHETGNYLPTPDKLTV